MKNTRPTPPDPLARRADGSILVAGMGRIVLRPLLDTTDPRFVRRIARAIRAECAANGFYSGHGVTPEMGCGQRKFHGHVKIVAGRLMAREVGGDGWTVDLTGIDHVNGNGNGEVYASRHP